MRKIIFFIAVLFLLAGCGVTPMLNPPLNENSIVREEVAAAAFTGTWLDAKDGRTLVITPQAKDGKQFLRIAVKDKVNAAGDNKAPLPFVGVPVRYAGGREIFIVLVADMENIRKLAGTSELLGLAARPLFFLVRPVLRSDGTLEISFVNWQKKEQDKEVVTDPGVKLQSGLVLNTPEELVKLMEGGKYVLTNTMLLRRQ